MKPVRPFFPLKSFILVVVFALPICLFLLEISEAAGIKNVQRGSVTFTAGANRMPVTLGQAVDPNKTIVWGGISHGGGRSSGANPNDTRISFDLESGTTLALERLGSPSTTPIVEWQAVEFTSGVSVQRGLRSLTTAETTVNVTIPTAVDLTKSFVLVSVAPNSTSQTTDEQWTIRSRLTTSTNLELSRNESGMAVDVYWQVIEMQGASVQRGLATMDDTFLTATIASVDPTKSFLVTSFKGNAGHNGVEGRYATRGMITNGTTLTFNRLKTELAVDIAWEVISMSDGTTVQSGPLSTAATTDATLNKTITAVDLSRTFVYLSAQGGTPTGTASLDEVSWTGTLTSSTNLRLQRAGTGSQGTINWEVIQFVAAPATKLAITSVNNGGNPVAGTGFSVTVQSQNDVGVPQNVQNNTAVSLSLKTGTGILSGTLTGTIAAGTNQVTISGVTYTKAESGVVLTATRTSGDTLTPGDSAPFTVNPGTATALAFTTQPGNTSAGTSIPGSPTVAVQDSSGNTVTSSTAAITIAIGNNPGGGTLSGTLTKNAVSGVVSFTDLSIDKVSSGYTLSVSSTGLTGSTSAAFTISPGAAAKLAFTTQPVGTNAGAVIGGLPTVAVQDVFSNTVTSSAASITVAIGTNPSGGALSGTTAKNASGGVASFSDLSIDQAGSGYTLTASSTGLTGASSNAFNIIAVVPDLVVTSISNPPASAVAGAAFNVTDTTANNGNGTAGASTTSYRLSLDNVITASDPLLTGSRSVPSLAASGNSSGTITVSIPSNLTAGTYFLGACADEANVVAESNEANNCLASTNTVAVSAAPNIASLSPTSAPIATSVTITGSNFGATQGSSTVKFNGTTATPTTWSATSIVAPVPTGATTGPVIVTVGGSASNAVNFSVTAPVGYVYDSLGRLIAVIDTAGDTAIYNYDAVGNVLSIDRRSSSLTSIIEFNPKSGSIGTTVTLQGTAYSTTPSQNTVTFNGTAATVTSATANSLTVTVPAGATSGLINVTTPAGSAASSVAFNVTGAVGAPTITNFTPTVGTAGTAVTITGTNFSATATNQIVRVNGSITNVSTSTSTTINTAVPAGTGSGRISVQTAGGSATSSADFFIPPSPFTAADVQFTGRMTIGSGLAVSITTPNKIALVVFDGTAGQWINVQMSNVTFGDGRSNVTVLGPNGSSIYSSTGVSSSGGSFSVQLPDSGGHGIAISGTPGATGGMNINLSPTAPGGNSLNLSCIGSCMMTCGPNASLSFNATGGKPPYNWSTTKGAITVSAVTRSSATVTPPPNAGGPQVAFSRYRWGTFYISPGCCNSILAEDYDCNGNVILQNNNACYDTGSGNWNFGTCGGGCRTPTCNGTPTKICVVEQANIGCGNCNVFVEALPRPQPSMPPANCTSQVDPVCAKQFGCGVNTNCYTVPYDARPDLAVGYLCDKRTPQMISSGCKPCGTEMNGAVVTVTDSNGNSAFKTILVNTP